MDLVLDGLSADAAEQLAAEEALVRAAPTTPVLRVWTAAPAVIVGRFQDIRREVALPACRSDGIPVLRRASGGGTVLVDEGTLNVSLTLPGRVGDAELRLARLLLVALGRLGVSAEPRPRGLFVRGYKLSGFAVLQTAAATLAHATVLVATSTARFRRYLLPAPRVPDRRDSHRAETASLREHGRAVSVPTVAAAVRAAVSEPLRPRAMHPAECAEHRRLLHRRYHDPAWHETGHLTRAPEDLTRAPEGGGKSQHGRPHPLVALPHHGADPHVRGSGAAGVPRGQEAGL